jgi:hypothetical protein
MANDSTYKIGYKMPPRHGQFTPGRSGNVHGRPKKTKTFPESLREELLALVSITEGGKRKRITKQAAMLRQHINKAIAGDARSMTIITNLWKLQGPEEGDNLPALLRLFEERHAHHEAADRNQISTTETAQPSLPANNDCPTVAANESAPATADETNCEQAPAPGKEPDDDRF